MTANIKFILVAPENTGLTLVPRVSSHQIMKVRNLMRRLVTDDDQQGTVFGFDAIIDEIYDPLIYFHHLMES